MGQAYITVGESNEKIPVNDCYSYMYEDSENGKTVLRIRIDPSIKTFDQLKTLFTSGEVIRHYVDDSSVPEVHDPSIPSTSDMVTETRLQGEHFNYCKEYKCNFDAAKNEFSIEITKKTAEETLLQENADQIANTMIALTELFELKA